MLFSCHFTTVSFPSEPPEQESRARGKVGARRGRLVPGAREVNLVDGEVGSRGGGGGVVHSACFNHIQHGRRVSSH